MALCVCDGPPHTYDPAWCVGGLKPAGRSPMVPSRPWGGETLRPPTDQRIARARARGQDTVADALAWIERLDSDAHWARGPAERDEKMKQAGILRDLIALAGG